MSTRNNFGVTWEEGTSAEELPQLHWPMGMPARHFLICHLIEKEPAICEWCQPYAGLSRETSLANERKETIKQYSFRFLLQVPVLSFLEDGL